MTVSPFEMRFDPQKINHLGLRMYSSLPPALAEIISNSYDADAENVTITLSLSYLNLYKFCEIMVEIALHFI